MTRVSLVHTVRNLEPVFADLARELLPGVDVDATVDEGLLQETIAAGRIRPATAARLEGHVDRALASGSDLVLVTCSSVAPAVEAIAADRTQPVLRIDEAMADRAIALGRRIGVLATLRTTLEPTADVIRRRAEAAGATGVELVSRVVDGAFDALRDGDLETHDRLVRDALLELAADVDVVVLAQASMARVAATLPPAVAEATPILSSPRLAMERVAERLGRASGGPGVEQPG